MFKNYLKIAWRNLFRNKGFSLTNILGLTIGITCTILILLWVQDEMTYDKFHKNYDNIYQVMANRDFNNTVFTDPNMVLPLASSLQKTYPQIRNAVVTSQDESHIFSTGENKIKKTGLTVGGNFFDMFSWKFIKGNASSALSDPYSVVLTESTAKAFFGNTDPINKVLKMDNNEEMKVAAVVADPPDNSTLQFDFIKTFNYSDPFIKNAMNEWVNSSWKVYLQMVPGADIAMLDKNINTLKKQHDANDKVSNYFTFPMSKWRLYSDFKNGKNVGGMIEYVRLFTIIAIIILLIACVNFMNLSTARSEKRAKEVGVRKTLGSGKKQLIFQFFCESMILSFIAFILSVVSVYLLLPSFNTLVDKHLSPDLYQQIQHVKNRDIGYNDNNLIMIPSTPDVSKNYGVIKQELLKTGLVNAVTRTFSPITEVWWKSPAPDWPGKPADAQIIVTGFSTDVDFTKTLDVKILQGKDFAGLPSDSSAMMLNQAAVVAMGLKNPIGTQMRYGSKTYTVTGVTGNVVMESPFKPVEPMMIYYRPDNSKVVDIRLNRSADLPKALKSIETVFKTYNPAVPFEYQFADQEFGKKFITEELISKLTNIFAGLAIFICCIGLAGLASFTIEKRIREIGIRKVMGASVNRILLLISKEFLKLVLIAFVIAVPVAWWGMNNWLEKYDYKINISLWLFVAVGLGILLLTLIVVSMNTLKAATSNPVKSLRSE